MDDVTYSERIVMYLGKQFNLPKEQVNSMMPDFLATLSSHMKRLEEVLQDNNLSNITKASHTIKGALLNLGLTDCAELALQIEKSSSSADETVDYATLVTSLGAIVSEIVNE